MNLRERLPILITATAAIALFVAAGLHFDHFFSLRVFVSLFGDKAFMGVAAVGLTFVILTGGIDLSVGSLVGCSSIMAASLIQNGHFHPLVALSLPLLFGLFVGWVQGILVAKFQLPSFLVTLAGLFFCRGMGFRISQEAISIHHPYFDSLTEFAIHLPGHANVNLPPIVFLIVVVIGAFVAKQTPFGRAIYAVGGNAASARLMGLPVQRTLVMAYMVSGFCAALGGGLFALYTSAGNASAGTGLELDAIAAVVIGGTLLSGGFGSVFGTLLGVCILGIVNSAITFQGTLSSWWTKIVIGVLLLAFMLVQKGIERAAKRRVHG